MARNKGVVPYIRVSRVAVLTCGFVLIVVMAIFHDYKGLIKASASASDSIRKVGFELVINGGQVQH